MTRRVFVSDIHMSQGLSLKDPHGCYDWFDDMEAGLFLDFLDSMAADGSLDELILLGDVLDSWIFPMKGRPPYFPEIANCPTSSKILEKIKAISAVKKVTYIIGNHDMTITPNSIPDFGNGACQTIAFQDVYETADGLYAEHGHRFGMYNAVDSKYTLPLGYYISRLQATLDSGSGKAPGRWQETLAGVLTALVTPSFNLYVDGPLNYFRGQIRDLTDTSPPFITEGGNPLTLGAVKEMYADLPARWMKLHGQLAPVESALQETPYGLVNQAEHLAKELGKRVVLFGHTHSPTINYFWKQKMGTLPDEPESVAVAVYANCGCWCQGDQKGTYVEDDYDEASDKHAVTLKSWPSRAPLGGTGPYTI